MNQIETLVAKLQLLAAKPSLSAAENAEAQALMQSLKAQGLSNEEISKASNGRWSVSTVKGYTTGIGVPSPNPWHDAVSALTDLIAANLSVDDVKAALAVNNSLAANKLALEDVTGFLKAVAAAGMNPAHLVNEVKALQKAGLSLQAAVSVNDSKEKMEGYGLTLEALPALVKIAQEYGNVQQALEAFSVYASLTVLQDEVSDAQKQLENINDKQAAAEQQLQQTEKKSQQLQGPIQAYQKIQEYGYSYKVLADLAYLAVNHGGPKTVIPEVKKYASLEDIKAKLSAAESKLADYETRISQAITKHGHLTSAIKMCETLIADHQYGLDAIGTILAVAQKFGEPVAVLKAVETYGKLEALEKRTGELAATVAEREKLLAGLETQFNEAKEKLDGLYGVVASLSDKCGRIEGRCKASENLQRMLKIIDEPAKATYEEHGQIVMMLVFRIRTWVEANEKMFKGLSVIKTGLEALFKELGGLS